MTERTKQLADDYAKGRLPEQRGQGDLTRWCSECRTPTGGARHFRTGVTKTSACKTCNSTGRISP